MQEDVIDDIEKKLDTFRYVGDVLATAKANEFDTIKKVIEYYVNLWEVTESLTDAELRKKNDEQVEINPGGYGAIVTEGHPVHFNVDKIIESLQSQEQYIEEILLALKKAFPRKFPNNVDFESKTGTKP